MKKSFSTDPLTLTQSLGQKNVMGWNNFMAHDFFFPLDEMLLMAVQRPIHRSNRLITEGSKGFVAMIWQHSSDVRSLGSKNGKIMRITWVFTLAADIYDPSAQRPIMIWAFIIFYRLPITKKVVTNNSKMNYQMALLSSYRHSLIFP